MKFNLRDTVTIEVSGETGKVAARCEYEASETQYLVRYQNAEGRAVEVWWGESALQ